MADHSAEIARLKAILNAGATTVVVDGQTVTYDLAQVRRRLNELIADDENSTVKRPCAARIVLGGF